MAFKIYTKTGDKGDTSLYGGKRLPKHHIRIECYGTIDELNSVIGICTAHIDDKVVLKTLNDIQIYLFNIGSKLACGDKIPESINKLKMGDTLDLENSIDMYTNKLPELKAFILPTGSFASTYVHLARTVCRRAERLVVLLNSESKIDMDIIIYLNRLSDYFFTLSRYLNHIKGIEETEWRGI